MSVELKDVMTNRVIAIEADASLTDAVKLMNKHEIGCLLVMKNGDPVGIITERDFLKRILAKSEELKNVKVKEVMSKPLVTGKPNMEIEDAARFMFQKKIKKLPIVENGKLLGLVTLSDLLRIQPQLIKMYKIFTSDLAPRRMRKVFDYYLLLQTETELVDIEHFAEQVKTENARYDRIIDNTSTQILEEEPDEKCVCPECGKEISKEFIVCPYCGFNLQSICPSCGKETSPDFKLCPYCGEKLRN
jgi:predicted transcriptional regulator